MATEWTERRDAKILYSTANAPQNDLKWSSTGNDPQLGPQTTKRIIVRVNVVLNRSVVVDSDWRFDNLCGSHRQSQNELYHVSWWYYSLVIGLIGQLRCDVICRLSAVIYFWRTWGQSKNTFVKWSPWPRAYRDPNVDILDNLIF